MFSRTSLLALLFVAGCDYDGSFLYIGPIEGVDAVIDIKGPDGGIVVPVDTRRDEVTALNDEIARLNAVDPNDPQIPVLESERADILEDVRLAVLDETIYAEVGPNGEAFPSGATIEFVGTGGDVCAFVDPEVIYWNQAVSATSPNTTYRFPDNPYDDGDLDMTVGLSVYYQGTPGQRMGTFEVSYTDDLGNDVAIDLVACKPLNDFQNQEPHSGRSRAEYCTVSNTMPGVSYTMALEAFGLPRDDGRLSFGAIVATGPCDGTYGLINTMAPSEVGNADTRDECVIRGEALPPKDGEAHRYYGYEAGRSWAGAEDIEQIFCEGSGLADYCRAEVQSLRATGLQCDYTGEEGWTDGESEERSRRCYCGDRNNTPSAGQRR